MAIVEGLFCTLYLGPECLAFISKLASFQGCLLRAPVSELTMRSVNRVRDKIKRYLFGSAISDCFQAPIFWEKTVYVGSEMNIQSSPPPLPSPLPPQSRCWRRVDGTASEQQSSCGRTTDIVGTRSRPTIHSRTE